MKMIKVLRCLLTIVAFITIAVLCSCNDDNVIVPDKDDEQGRNDEQTGDTGDIEEIQEEDEGTEELEENDKPDDEAGNEEKLEDGQECHVAVMGAISAAGACMESGSNDCEGGFPKPELAAMIGSDPTGNCREGLNCCIDPDQCEELGQLASAFGQVVQCVEKDDQTQTCLFELPGCPSGKSCCVSLPESESSE